MGDFESWAHKFWSMLQDPETAIVIFAGLIALSFIGAIAGFLTRKVISLIFIAAIVYALMIYGDLAVIWFQRTF